MKIAQKEANESMYWLILCGRLNDLPVKQEMLTVLNDILAILSKIITTSKKNLS